MLVDTILGVVLFLLFILYGFVLMHHSASLAALNEKVRLAEEWLRRLQDWRDNVRSRSDQ